jgi:hypothetical protein
MQQHHISMNLNKLTTLYILAGTAIFLVPLLLLIRFGGIENTAYLMILLGVIGLSGAIISFVRKV